MDRKPLKIGNKIAGLPLIQGGMGVGVSLGGLAGAVAKEGGVGIISSAQIGFREPDFDRNPLEANLRAMRSEYEKARAIAPGGVIGFNIMVASREYERYVKAAAEMGADLIISGAGLPVELPEIAKGYEISLAPIVSTEKSARVILKYWDKRYAKVPDLLVIEGPKAGGHLGFTLEQLEKFLSQGNWEGTPQGSGKDRYREEISAIINTVRQYEKKYQCKIPVAIAGGIEDRKNAQQAFELGADAVQVATRFVTTAECDADIRYKEAYLRARKEDIVIVKSPVGMPGRAICNTFMRRVMSGEKIPHSPCHRCLKKCSPSEIPYCITDALIRAARGETEDGLLFCGAGAYRAHRIETVKEVIESIL